MGDQTMNWELGFYALVLVLGYQIGRVMGFADGHRIGWTDGVSAYLSKLLEAAASGKPVSNNVIQYPGKKPS
jgi:hypothetical protein